MAYLMYGRHARKKIEIPIYLIYRVIDSRRKGAR